jgi:hypothetical protein
MDKKIHKVTLMMKKAEKDVKQGSNEKHMKKAKLNQAVKLLKGAKKKNEKLKVEDRDVRDPMIDKFKKAKKAIC